MIKNYFIFKYLSNLNIYLNLNYKGLSFMARNKKMSWDLDPITPLLQVDTCLRICIIRRYDVTDVQLLNT